MVAKLLSVPVQTVEQRLYAVGGLFGGAGESAAWALGSATAAMLSGEPRKALKYSYLYPKALLEVRRAVDAVEKATGYTIKKMPILFVWHKEAALVGADYRDGRIRAYGQHNLNPAPISHEVFHHAQSEYRASINMDDAEARFVIAASLPGPGIIPAQLAVDRASLLWNSINESGCYIFGHYAQLAGQAASCSASDVLIALEKHYGFRIEDIAPHLMGILRHPEKKIPETIDVGGMMYKTITLSAIVLCAAAYAQNGFDTKSLLRQSLRPPQDTIAMLHGLDAGIVEDSIATTMSMLR
jgi:hypothetical protein